MRSPGRRPFSMRVRPLLSGPSRSAHRFRSRSATARMVTGRWA